MANSKIEWTTKTWNPTTGCTKISKECDNCYAEVMTKRCVEMHKSGKYKQGFDVFVMHEEALKEPYRWKNSETIFVNSMSDLFHKDVTLDFLKKVFKVMKENPQHTFQILTKRHHELEKYSDELEWTDNIWMGVSVGHSAGVRRINCLANCGAKHKFLSVEPLIEELPDLDLTGIEWVIVGGESGKNNSRPMKKEWVLKVKKNCDEQKVPFFFKQWGMVRNNPYPKDPTINKDHSYHSKGGCQIDGEIFWKNPTVKDDSIVSIKAFDEEYLVMDDFEDLKTIWELKSFLPAINDQVYKELKQNIKASGLYNPILYYKSLEGDKIVIEGFDRLKACIQLKKNNIDTIEIKEYFESINEMKIWMLKDYIQKEPFSDFDKIKLTYSLRDAVYGVGIENLLKEDIYLLCEEMIDLAAEIAKIVGVTTEIVEKYIAVLDLAPKTVIKKMDNKELTIESAFEKLKTKPQLGLGPKLDKTKYYVAS